MNAAHLLLASALALGLAPAPGPARAQSVGAEVLDALDAEGRVRVLIALEPPLDRGLMLQARRWSVQATQGEVLARVGAGDLEVVHRHQGAFVTDPRNGLAHPLIDAEAAFLSLELCDDGIDNDEDGLVDVEDPDRAPVEIEIRPRRHLNFVWLFGLEDLDGYDVDPASLAFGPEGAAPQHDLTDPDVLARHLRDVDHDGLIDLVTHYRAAETGIGYADTEACLSGRIGVEAFRACDEVIPRCRGRASAKWKGGPFGALGVTNCEGSPRRTWGPIRTQRSPE